MLRSICTSLRPLPWRNVPSDHVTHRDAFLARAITLPGQVIPIWAMTGLSILGLLVADNTRSKQESV